MPSVTNRNGMNINRSRVSMPLAVVRSHCFPYKRRCFCSSCRKGSCSRPREILSTDRYSFLPVFFLSRPLFFLIHFSAGCGDEIAEYYAPNMGGEVATTLASPVHSDSPVDGATDTEQKLNCGAHFCEYGGNAFNYNPDGDRCNVKRCQSMPFSDFVYVNNYTGYYAYGILPYGK